MSVYYWLKNNFSTIDIEDDFPDVLLTLPCIAVVPQVISIRPKQLGSREGNKVRLWDVEVFGNTKTQRDSMAYQILDYLENPILVYNYDEGFVNPSQIGALLPIQDSITLTPMRIFPDLTQKLYWRSSIKFLTEYESHN